MQLLFDLVYREKGEKKSRQLKIDFVSNYMRREISQYFIDANDVKNKWDDISNILSTIAGLKSERPDGWKDKIKELEEGKEAATQEILKHNNTGLPYKNIEIIIELLKDNGVKDDMLLSRDFWDRCVEPPQIIKILADALDKDIGKKKGNI